LAPTLDQALFAIVAFSIWTLVGAMKWFVRQAPVLGLALPGVGAWVVATMIVITLMVVIVIIVLTGA
jgi:hypothetical protein